VLFGALQILPLPSCPNLRCLRSVARPRRASDATSSERSDIGRKRISPKRALVLLGQFAPALGYPPAETNKGYRPDHCPFHPHHSNFDAIAVWHVHPLIWIGSRAGRISTTQLANGGPLWDGVSSHLAAPLRRGFFGRLPLTIGGTQTAMLSENHIRT
jgi:hypothetical protein